MGVHDRPLHRLPMMRRLAPNVSSRRVCCLLSFQGRIGLDFILHVLKLTWFAYNHTVLIHPYFIPDYLGTYFYPGLKSVQSFAG